MNLSVPPGFRPLPNPTIPLQSSPTNLSSPEPKSPPKLEHSAPTLGPVGLDLALAQDLPSHLPPEEPIRRKRGRPPKDTSGTSLNMGQNQSQQIPFLDPIKRKRGRPAKPISGPCLAVGQNQNQCYMISKGDSELQDRMIQVGSFRVRANMFHTLQAILHKQGDIAKDFELEPSYVLSGALENICSVVQELETTKFVDVREKQLAGFYSVVRDAEKLKLNVKWLREGLDRIYQTVGAFHHYKEVEESLKMAMQQMKSIQEALELKRAEMSEIKATIQDLQGQLELEILKTEKFCSSMDDISSRWNSIHNTFISNGLLYILWMVYFRSILLFSCRGGHIVYMF